MGTKLVEVVEYVRRHSRGNPIINLARLNLLVGRALSRNAVSIPDEQEIVDRSWTAAREIVGTFGDAEKQ